MAKTDHFPGFYLGVKCASCKKPIPFVRDPEHGLTALEFDGDPILRLRCPHCHVQSDYHKGQVERYREEQTG
jgi:hypothetical protein